MMEFVNERMFFAFSDPGGAKPILALASMLQKNNEIFICSNRNYDFYDEFQLNVKVIHTSILAEVMESFNPSIIINGTSYTTDFETTVINIGNKKGLETNSFVDNWSNFLLRFTQFNELVLPNKVWVLDEAASANALKEGIEKQKIFVLGFNPYWKYLEKWKPTFSKQKIYEQHNLDFGKEYVYFVPDPLTNVGGIEKFGFDEYTSTNDLITFYKDFNFIFKLHPNQDLNIMALFAGQKITFITDNVFHNHLIYFSHEVVSFFSNVLVEAKILGANPKRYLKGLKIEDPFEDKSIDIAFW